MYRPGRDVELSLKQLFGMGQGRINDALDAYLSHSPEPHSDQSFMDFCKGLNAPVNQPTISAEWTPTTVAVDDLPMRLLEGEYLPIFKRIYTGKPIRNGNYDELYREFCRMRWASDSRNKGATGSTFMTMEWEPSESILEEMAEAGVDNIPFVIGEFKLFWKECGAHRANWNSILEEHISRWTKASRIY